MAALKTLINQRGVNTYITRMSADAHTMAVQANQIQTLAEQSRLGIPVTISSDPRNHFQYTLGASAGSSGFSQWPETLGFAAIGDAALTRNFGDIARQEYRAVGITEALSPQADLATEPRWAASTARSARTPISPARRSRPISKASRAAATASRPRASSPSSSTGPDTARRNSASTATITTAAMRPIRATISPIT